MELFTNYIDIIKLGISSAVTLLGVFLSWFLKYKYGEYKHRKITREISQSKLVQTILEQQLQEYGAQRGFILQRHNGGKYGTGKSMTKLSTTFEALEEGVSTEFKEYQNLPISLYSGLVDVVQNERGIFPIIEDIDDILTRAFFTQRGTKTAVVYPISRGADLVGMVGFEWTHKAKNIENSYVELKQDGKVIGETLSKLL
jgi:hypothetical protein